MSDVDPRRALVFGSYAAEYERWRPGYPDEAVAWLVPTGANRVADVGAGTGKLTGSLLALGLQVAAIEPDPLMLAELTARHPGAEGHRADAAGLPLPDASVDAVLVAQAWHWFPHEQALAEARRVTRPGGWLGILGNAADPKEPWERQLLRLDPDGRDDEDHNSDWEIPGVSGERVETAAFAWQEQITAETLRERSATYSAYATMPAPERARQLDALVAVVAAEAARRGTAMVPLSHATHCARVYL